MPEGSEQTDEDKPRGTEATPLNPNLAYHSTSGSPTSFQTNDYVRGIKKGDRVMLSRAITLLESTRPDHQRTAHEILNRCLPDTGDSVRVAITGVPGVGKSTFIETLGQRLVKEDHRLAVLAIDPSSERSKGSILGDKTRMGQLATSDNVYIRPSPTSGSLGGVARKTRETIFLCEAAGYDTIFVETVGVGQAEVKVHSMVDVFLLLALAGAGDQLQGIKRGIVEMADVVAINKADGRNRDAAESARSEYARAFELLGPTESGWEPKIHTCSAQTGDGIGEVWASMEQYVEHVRNTGYFDAQRRRQARHWMYQTIEDQLRDDFFDTPAVDDLRKEVEKQVQDGNLSSVAAAEKLLEVYRRSIAGD